MSHCFSYDSCLNTFEFDKWNVNDTSIAHFHIILIIVDLVPGTVRFSSAFLEDMVSERGQSKQFCVEINNNIFPANSRSPKSVKIVEAPVDLTGMAATVLVYHILNSETTANTASRSLSSNEIEWDRLRYPQRSIHTNDPSKICSMAPEMNEEREKHMNK